MKKIKIMFLSLAVITAVGGALAFKTTKKFDLFYTKDANTGFCTDPIQATIEGVEPLGAFQYTTTIAPTAQEPCLPAINFYAE